jgi:hypothetical protein
MANSVILSPHLDDAALSCWHVIEKPGTTVVNVFVGVPPAGTTALWDRICGQPKSNLMSKARLKENEAALKDLVKNINLKYLDNQYEHPTRDIEALSKDILSHVDPESHFYAPAAISKLFIHKDHAVLRDVGLYLLSKGHNVSFYADIPYMTPSKNTRYASRAQKILGFPTDINLHQLDKAQLSHKISALREYKSQMGLVNITSLGGLNRAVESGQELTFEPL